MIFETAEVTHFEVDTHRKSCVAHQMAGMPVTLSDLRSHFSFLKSFEFHTMPWHVTYN